MVEPPTPTAALAVGAIIFTSRPMIPSARALMRYRGPIFSPDSLSMAFVTVHDATATAAAVAVASCRCRSCAAVPAAGAAQVMLELELETSSPAPRERFELTGGAKKTTDGQRTDASRYRADCGPQFKSFLMPAAAEKPPGLRLIDLPLGGLQ